LQTRDLFDVWFDVWFDVGYDLYEPILSDGHPKSRTACCYRANKTAGWGHAKLLQRLASWHVRVPGSKQFETQRNPLRLLKRRLQLTLTRSILKYHQKKRPTLQNLAVAFTYTYEEKWRIRFEPVTLAFRVLT
jgi:hypothetical protein